VAAPQAGAKSQTAVVAQAAVFQKTHAITSSPRLSRPHHGECGSGRPTGHIAINNVPNGTDMRIPRCHDVDPIIN
jgi:hypothetical protein